VLEKEIKAIKHILKLRPYTVISMGQCLIAGMIKMKTLEAVSGLVFLEQAIGDEEIPN